MKVVGENVQGPLNPELRDYELVNVTMQISFALTGQYGIVQERERPLERQFLGR